MNFEIKYLVRFTQGKEIYSVQAVVDGKPNKGFETTSREAAMKHLQSLHIILASGL